jgi:hypothetical protein
MDVFYNFLDKDKTMTNTWEGYTMVCKGSEHMGPVLSAKVFKKLPATLIFLKKEEAEASIKKYEKELRDILVVTKCKVTI